MLYFGVDQHEAQITINLRNEQGDIIQTVQVGTQHDSITQFFRSTGQTSRTNKKVSWPSKVCGFNHRLIKKLEDYDCKEIVLMQPDKTSNKKTFAATKANEGEIAVNNGIVGSAMVLTANSPHIR